MSTYYDAGYETASQFTNNKGQPIIPDTGSTVSAFLTQFPEFYSNSGYKRTQAQFKQALSSFRKGLKAGSKALRRKTNPPTNKWIPAKAVRFNRDGSVSIKK